MGGLEGKEPACLLAKSSVSMGPGPAANTTRPWPCGGVTWVSAAPAEVVDAVLRFAPGFLLLPPEPELLFVGGEIAATMSACGA